ncbi:MAG TPA: hypothetical protein VE198_15755 [Actinoallomurus sp.]|nr:hypothetical protein [Actinoallomurus sp.]
MRILVVNAGSSSLKLSLLDHDDTLIARPTRRWGSPRSKAWSWPPAPASARWPPPSADIALDPARDDTTDAEITQAGAAVRTFVITAREDLEIANAVREILDR